MTDTALPSRSGVTIRRAPAVDESWGTFVLQYENCDSMDLPPEGVRTLFLWPKPTRLDILQGGRVIWSKQLDMQADSKVDYRLDLAPAGLLDRLLNRPPKLDLVEQSRAYLAPYDPGPVRMITQQIWVGTADNKDSFFDLMAERPEYYSEENEEAEGTDAHIALSAFAQAMGEDSYDHDFLEYGFAKDGDTLETRFKGHSWVEQWAPLVREMLSPQAVDAVNVFIIMGVDDGPHAKPRRQFNTPRDLNLGGLSLRYLGEVTHPSH